MESGRGEGGYKGRIRNMSHCKGSFFVPADEGHTVATMSRSGRHFVQIAIGQTLQKQTNKHVFKRKLTKY